MQSRQAPTGVSPSRSQERGDAFAVGSRGLQDGLAFQGADNSPSIRTESFFCGKAVLLYLAHFGDFDVATQASARFIQRLFMAQAHDHLGVGTDPHDRSQHLAVVPVIGTGNLWRILSEFKIRQDLGPSGRTP